MATIRQIEANRRNSQLSTGPRTPEGKAVSRFNALKTGIHAQSQVIPGEDPADLEQLASEYHDQYQPATAEERFLVDTLVSSEWQLRRLRKAQAQLWHHEIKDAGRSVLGRPLDEECPLGQIFDRASNNILRMHRMLQATERTHFRALKELQRLQAAHPVEAPPEELAPFRQDPAVPDAPPPPIVGQVGVGNLQRVDNPPPA